MSSSTSVVILSSLIPQYPNRAGNNRKADDLGDGGAYPEIHIAQYPLGMGSRKDAKPGMKILPVTVDSHGGNVALFDAIVKQNENASKIVYSQHRDLVPKIPRAEEEDEEMEEEQKEIDETTMATKAALEKIVSVRLSAVQPKNVAKQSSDSKFIKYRAKERVVMIRMGEMPVDPLEPPKWKRKRVPRAGSGSPPVPIMHSPTRPVSVKDQEDWKIPPCISNSKNPKGYTIPLDKRLLAAGGRGLQDVGINDQFAKLPEALYVAEQMAREAVAMRRKVQKEMAMKEKERREDELRALAEKARAIPSDRMSSSDVGMRGERLQREKIREERRREREKERRLEAKDAWMGKKSRITRDRDREVSEKVALGMASTGASKGGEVMYDQRLFNQEKGMDSGFATDDQYNVYDKAMFAARTTLSSTLYRPNKDADSEMYGGPDEQQQLEKIRKTDRFKPDRAFAGTSEKTTGGGRDRPVEFDKEADPFGLDQFLTEVNRGKKAWIR